MERPDEQLMELCRRGNVSALKRLMLRYQDKLMAFIYSLVRDYHLAEDIFQETFLRVYRQADTFLPGYKFQTWLYAIANNLCRDEWRRRRRRPQLAQRYSGAESREEAGPRLEEAPDGAPGPREIAGARELEEMLDAELGRLTPEHREVVVMARLLGLKYQEIAEVLKIPSGTVRSRLHYALEELRQRLGNPKKS